MATVNVTAVTKFVAEQIFELNMGMNPLINSANRFYVDQYDNSMPYAPGRTVDIKVPGYPAVTTGLPDTAQPIQDLTLPYVISEQDIYNVTREVDVFSIKFDFKGGAGALTDSQKRNVVDAYALPAYLAMQQKQENVAAFRMKTNAMYTPIDTVEKLSGINNFSGVSQVAEFMDNLQYQTDERWFMMNLKDAYAVSNSMVNFFNPTLNKNIANEAWVGGSSEKAELSGLKVMKSKNLTKHTAGALAGVAGLTVSSVSLDGTQITITGIPGSPATQVINAGDYISIPSVQLISPIDKVVFDKKLVVKALVDANGDGAGNVVVTLPYPLMASGEHANVDSLPVPGAAVTVYPSRNLNFAYVPSGLSVVPLPLGEVYGAANSENKAMNKCPINVYMQGSVSTLANIFRISQLIGIRSFTPYIVEIPSAAA